MKKKTQSNTPQFPWIIIKFPPIKKATGVKCPKMESFFQWLLVIHYTILCFLLLVRMAANWCVRQHELEAVQLVYLAGTWVIVNGGDI